MQSLPGGIVSLTLAGFAQSLSMVALTVILLRSSDPRLRGRIVGVRMLAIYSLPLGLLAAGALIERIGFEHDHNSLRRDRSRVHRSHSRTLARLPVAAARPRQALDDQALDDRP